MTVNILIASHLVPGMLVPVLIQATMQEAAQLITRALNREVATEIVIKPGAPLVLTAEQQQAQEIVLAVLERRER